MALDGDIDRILFTEEQISKRVSELASLISDDFAATADSPSPPVVIGVATGAFLFLADLVRKVKVPLYVDFIRAESYGCGTKSNGAPRISLALKVDVQDKHVIVPWLKGGIGMMLALDCLMRFYINHLAAKRAQGRGHCGYRKHFSLSDISSEIQRSFQHICVYST
ncbi:uncharacterized protein LOC127800044 isoform X2 [Diospyros lotus]|uniref:uncharacterized protein LOC127800044 isoform X2 n=1 Tax=Diospyros lotus TaxID=55363 RepID=UPI002257D826|nr:uncharacterized protein LOC127800044 isoform X2 [Diospyros lotus]